LSWSIAVCHGIFTPWVPWKCGLFDRLVLALNEECDSRTCTSIRRSGRGVAPIVLVRVLSKTEWEQLRCK
jgi:hypothetical protein